MRSIPAKINTPGPLQILLDSEGGKSLHLLITVNSHPNQEGVCVCVCVVGGGVLIFRGVSSPVSAAWPWVWPLAMAGAPEVKICFPWGCVKENGSTSHMTEVFPKQLLQLGECGRLSFPSISSRKKQPEIEAGLLDIHPQEVQPHPL